MKTSLKNRLRIVYFTIIPSRRVTQKREFMLELKRGGHARVHTEMVEFTALPFSFSSKLKIRSFQVNCRIRYNSVRMKLHKSQSISTA